MWRIFDTLVLNVTEDAASDEYQILVLDDGNRVDTRSAADVLSDIGGAPADHSLLSGTHGDTTTAAVVRGDVITGQGATPAWTRLAVGTAGQFLKSDGTDIGWDNPLFSIADGIISPTNQSNTIDLTASNVIFVPIDADIQEYVDNAVNGDTLILASGTYTLLSSLTIDKQINIIGQGSIMYADGESITAIHITNENVRVYDLIINLEGSDSTGILIETDLQGCILSNILVNIDCSGAAIGYDVHGSDVVIRDSKFNIVSQDSYAVGVRHWSTISQGDDHTVDCFNVSGVVMGADTSAYGFLCEIQ